MWSKYSAWIAPPLRTPCRVEHAPSSMGVSPCTLQRSLLPQDPNILAASALGCPTVGWRINRANTTLQRAIGSPGHSISRETSDESYVTLQSHRWGGIYHISHLCANRSGNRWATYTTLVDSPCRAIKMAFLHTRASSHCCLLSQIPACT